MNINLLFDVIKWISGIIVFFITLYYTIRHFKINKTLSYIERFNSASMLESRKKIDDWSKLLRDEKIECLKNDVELKNHIRLIYNLITEIGISYQYRIINRKLTCLTFDPLIPNYWEKLQPYITYQKNSNYPFGYSFKKLSDEIVNSRNKSYKQKRIKKIKDEINSLIEKEVQISQNEENTKTGANNGYK